FQQNPYPGIATRERLARELGIAESRVQVGPRLCPRSPFQALHADPSRLKATGGLSPQKAFSLFAPRSGSKTNAEGGSSRADRRLNTCTKKGKRGRRPRPHHRRARLDLSLPLQVT
ncbi:homeobox domain-containing protein, partial [Helicobacter pylori]